MADLYMVAIVHRNSTIPNFGSGSDGARNKNGDKTVILFPTSDTLWGSVSLTHLVQDAISRNRRISPYKRKSSYAPHNRFNYINSVTTYLLVQAQSITV